MDDFFFDAVLLRLVFNFLGQFTRHRFLCVNRSVHELVAFQVVSPSTLWGIFVYADRKDYHLYFYLSDNMEIRLFFKALRSTNRQFLRWTFFFFNKSAYVYDLLDGVFGSEWRRQFPENVVKGHGRGVEKYGSRRQLLDIWNYLYIWYEGGDERNETERNEVDESDESDEGDEGDESQEGYEGDEVMNGHESDGDHGFFDCDEAST